MSALLKYSQHKNMNFTKMQATQEHEFFKFLRKVKGCRALTKIYILFSQWNSGNVITMGWSSTEELLCIQEDGVVLVYDMFLTFKRTFSMGQVGLTKHFKITRIHRHHGCLPALVQFSPGLSHDAHRAHVNFGLVHPASSARLNVDQQRSCFLYLFLLKTKQFLAVKLNFEDQEMSY